MDLRGASERIESAIAEGVFPGAALGVAVDGRTHTRYHGRQTYCPTAEPIDASSIWDLASVTKVVGTTTLVAQLIQRRELRLDDPVTRHVPTFRDHGKEAITVRNLMVHDSGLIAFRPFHRSCTTRDEVYRLIDTERLQQPIGAKMVYSDLNLILIQRVLESINGSALHRLAKEQVFCPHGLADTGWIHRPEGMDPLPDVRRYVPTEVMEPWRVNLRALRRTFQSTTRSAANADHAYLQGEVHDPTATVLEGVAGHAGLFSTLPDMLQFMDRWTQGRVVPTELVREFTRRQSEGSSRAIGWDTKSPQGSSAGREFGPRSFGHTGYTGTSVWHDPDRELTVVLLTNRVHPTSTNTKIIAFRPELHDAIVQALPARG
ncbi:MAG: serine hydrolase domain-containing protein [Fimbriimonadaceae bacterium]|nr:serine hydrolase domain-containing protein [Fimbriimonadaceae bacterium]